MRTLNGVSPSIVEKAHAVELTEHEAKEIKSGTALLVAAAIDNASAEARSHGQGTVILVVTKAKEGDVKEVASEPQEAPASETPKDSPAA